VTAVLAREAFGAEFVGADGFLNTPTYGLPPRFLIDALQDCIGQWQAGTMEAASFDDPVRAGRAGYAALTGVPVDAVAMGDSVSAVLGVVAAAVPDGSRVATLARRVHQHHLPVRSAGRQECDDHRAGARSVGVGRGRLRCRDGQPGAVRQRCRPRYRRAAAQRFGHGHVSGTDTLTVIDVTQALGWKLLDVGARPVSVPRFAPARRASGFISTTPTTTWTVCWTLCVSEA
jgi:hypothetical protein